MRLRGFGEAIRLMLDPGSLMLFILASILLSVFSNTVFSLAVEMLGTSPNKLWYIFWGSLAIFVLIAIVLRQRLNSKRLRPAVVVPEEQQGDPHKGLIVFLADNPNASEKSAIGFHLDKSTLRYCWLVVSPETAEKAEQLKGWIKQHPNGRQVIVQPIQLENAFQAHSSYTAVTEALSWAGPIKDDVIVDITAGTKFMTAGAVLACRDNSIPMQYVRIPYAGRPDIRAEPKIMKVEL